MPKHTKQTKWFLFSWLNKQMDLKGPYSVWLCLYVADPATILASNDDIYDFVL